MLITEKTAIASDELLARFILHRRLLRPDKTIKPEAVIPHPYQDLSVTRHLRLTEKALWETGQNVARQTGKTLCGRADILAAVFYERKLQVVAAPIPDNQNHANVVGWPAEKPAQKIIALEIADAAGKMRELPS